MVNPAVPPVIFTFPTPSLPPIVVVELCSEQVKTIEAGSVKVTEEVAVQLTASVMVMS